ncbi:MAG TPA: endonuclease/exonuclease/phosphatase family protein [Candidatus Saccharibacteria bacterium]|nr:endonuclease/exonuclease/phosphatase family protein [Candidatus Saccharibacteria bacterium]
MRLISLNLQGFDNWNTRRPNIIKFISDTNPDLVFFQEAVYLPELSTRSNASDLNQDLGFPYEHVSITRLQVGLEYPIYREGLAAISKFPVIKTETIVLKKADGDNHNRIIQLIDVTIDDKIIKLANVHFSITDITDFATAHLAETLEILNARNEERIIIGDFNLSSLDKPSDIWEAKYSATNDRGIITYPSMNKCTDYALVPKTYKISNIHTSGDELSDHRAVTVDII